MIMIYSDDFELFWRSYPPRFNEGRNVYIRADKCGAFREWERLTLDEKVLALNAVQREKPSKWTPDARKWLYHKRWEDVVAPLREYERPAKKEVEAMIDKLARSFHKVPDGGMEGGRMGYYRMNKARNEAKNKLGVH